MGTVLGSPLSAQILSEEITGKGWAEGVFVKGSEGEAVSQSNVFGNKGVGRHSGMGFCSSVGSS